MFFRKNKKRMHHCECGHEYLNTYYGTKSYNEVPLYYMKDYVLEWSNCAWCKQKYYYLVRKED